MPALKLLRAVGPALCALALVTPAFSQAPDAPIAPAGCALAAGTAIEIEFADTVTSRANHPGDHFAIRLRAPIMAGDAVAVPAQTTGIGEVVHAARARAMGKAGELIVAARYIEFDGQRLPLRSLHFGASGTGENHVGAVFAAGLVVGPLPFLIAGGEVVYPAGLVATVSLAAPATLPHACGTHVQG